MIGIKRHAPLARCEEFQPNSGIKPIPVPNIQHAQMITSAVLPVGCKTKMNF